MRAGPIALPQAPRNRTVAYSGLLSFPDVGPLTPLAVQAKALEFQLRSASLSSRKSLDRLCSALASPDWGGGEAYPGLADELEPYVQASERERAFDPAKVRAEFAVYSHLVARHSPFAAMDGKRFVAFLVDLHRRLGTGLNRLRNRPVALRPDDAGNRVVFPDHRLCRSLLTSLHRFLAGCIGEQPGLCATVAFAAVVHAHPFDDGNGRTARTLYNLILAEGTGTRHFVPIHALAALRPVVGIKLKRAILGRDWHSLQAFFTDAARLSRRLQAGEPRGRNLEAGCAAAMTS
jgi:Fic/DOC family